MYTNYGGKTSEKTNTKMNDEKIRLRIKKDGKYRDMVQNQCSMSMKYWNNLPYYCANS
jgi:hypothetical protein